MFVTEMTRKMILIDSVEKVKAFVTTINKSPVAVDLKTGRFQIDAKSIMGVFSLDVSKPLEMRIYANDETAGSVLESVKEFIIGDAPDCEDPYEKS